MRLGVRSVTPRVQQEDFGHVQRVPHHADIFLTMEKRVTANPLVSIIVPVYNIEQNLRKCVESLLRQTYPVLEVILVNDGSTDDSGTVCDEFVERDSRVRVLHQANGGVSSARNAGLSSSRGDYICFVDGDDYVEDDFVQLLLENSIRFDAGISSCGYVRHTGGTATGQRTREIIVHDRISGAVESIRNPALHASVWNHMFVRHIVDRLNFSTLMTIGEDDLFTSLAYFRASRSVHDSAQKYHYIIRQDSAMQSRSRLNEDRLHLVSQLRTAVAEDHALTDLIPHIDAREVIEYVQLLMEVARNPELDPRRGTSADYVEVLRQLGKRNLSNVELSWKHKVVLAVSLAGVRPVLYVLRVFTWLERFRQRLRRELTRAKSVDRRFCPQSSWLSARRCNERG